MFYLKAVSTTVKCHVQQSLLDESQWEKLEIVVEDAYFTIYLLSTWTLCISGVMMLCYVIFTKMFSKSSFVQFRFLCKFKTELSLRRSKQNSTDTFLILVFQQKVVNTQCGYDVRKKVWCCNLAVYPALCVDNNKKGQLLILKSAQTMLHPATSREWQSFSSIQS